MRILVIRNSAMGDVALAAPVLKAFTETYPNDEIVLVTRKTFHPFFRGIKNIHLVDTDYTDRHKGVGGIYQLHKDIEKTGKIDVVIDLHGVIRSKMFRTLFSTKGAKVFVIDKGRKEKKDLIKGLSKTQLKHTVERYTDVFIKAGFPLEVSTSPSISVTESANKKTKEVLVGSELKIGIAPFAKHGLKQWPLIEMKSLMDLISENSTVHFYLLGGSSEGAVLQEIAPSNSTILAGKYSLEEELGIISNLDLVITLDSSNMHMASLVGTPVISIWGATDPLAGFGAWGQPIERSISNTELNCRPCSIYGKGTCARKDFACMTQLTAQIVYERILKTGLIPNADLTAT